MMQSLREKREELCCRNCKKLNCTAQSTEGQVAPVRGETQGGQISAEDRAGGAQSKVQVQGKRVETGPWRDALTLPQPAPSRARTLEAGKRWARLAQARAASRPAS